MSDEANHLNKTEAPPDNELYNPGIAGEGASGLPTDRGNNNNNDQKYEKEKKANKNEALKKK